jgi:eukaryotic-like serine/threonine-protein kinase
MDDITADQFAQQAFDFGLISNRELNAVWGELGTHTVELKDFTAVLLRRELMTNFQIDRLLAGERTGYFYGPYKVLYLVGAGTFARVYRAVHKETGRIVAVKVLRKRYRDDPVQMEQFMREGEMGRQLRHVNIVNVYDVHRGKTPFMVLEFVEGRNLREFVKVRKKLDWDLATSLCEDICAGLAQASEVGVTHRDLKLSNVLVTSDGRAKLVDFGLAAAVGASYDNLDDCPNARTIDYAGLERVSGCRKDDPRSDIFFVGCIFYQMLSGKPALFETKERSQRLSSSRYMEIRPLEEIAPDIPRPLVLVCNKAMEVKVDRRYNTPGDMLKDLQLARHKIATGDDSDPEDSDGQELLAMEGQDHTIMVIESNVEMQNFLREKLKKRGYRVLVLSSASRALQRFRDDEHLADGLIISSGELGLEAIEAFKVFQKEELTKHIPVVLLYAPNQKSVREMITEDAFHVAVPRTIKVRQLREILLKLLLGAADKKTTRS